MRSVSARVSRLEAMTPSGDVADLTDVELFAAVDRSIAALMRDGPPELRRRLAGARGLVEQAEILLRLPNAGARCYGHD